MCVNLDVINNSRIIINRVCSTEVTWTLQGSILSVSACLVSMNWVVCLSFIRVLWANRGEKKARKKKKLYFFYIVGELTSVENEASFSIVTRILILSLYIWSTETWQTYIRMADNKVKDQRLNQLLPVVKLRISRNNHFGIRQEKSKVRI